MEGEEAKLFIGGITRDTTEDTLRDHFSKYGDVTHAVVMHDKLTGRPRGFAFVVFNDHSALHSSLLDQHTIDGRLVEVKRALSREEQSTMRQETSNDGRGSGGGGNRTKKIFVGGLPPSVTEEGFRQYFENFGHVTDAVIMYDQTTQRPRGFGFVSFDTEEEVERVLQKNFHDLNGKDVEVKRALPKDSSQANSSRGGGYQNYGSSRGNSGSYDNRMEGNRYMQPPNGGFSSYPGYGAAGYGGGYGAPAGSYGGYGGYGVGSYAGGAAGFAGHAGGYGGSNAAAGAGYGSGPANAMKAAWSNQTAGYGAAGYGAGYAASTGYGTGASAQTGQSHGGGPGYGNQAYGGGYGGNGYGAVGGRTGGGATGNPNGGEQSATGSGYMGSGYGDNNRNSGYGGGYGDAQSWQGQQQ
ncbi:hypothetical protein vseg_003848 [Gypsophila vaccaria]